MGSSEAALLQKLSIRPFTYGLVIECVYDNGSVFDAAVLDLTDADMADKFSAACANVAALSLELGIPTLASLPHSIANAFRSMVGLVIEGCDTYSFEAADLVKVREEEEEETKRGTECSVGGQLRICTRSTLPTRSRWERRRDERRYIQGVCNIGVN